LFCGYCVLPNLHSFPTRRSSDLLNWDSFKWRNYDYAIGRFLNIDPLSEKYPYNSTYAFQENKMGLGRELEGLELVFTHGTWAKRSEEHTSELQSRENLVCRLLLE